MTHPQDATPANPAQGVSATVEAILRKHIKVDATGLAPAIASAYVVGFEEAAREIAAIGAGGQAVDSCLSPAPVQEAVARCCSSISPCSWQRHNGMDSVCPTCTAATSPASQALATPPAPVQEVTEASERAAFEKWAASEWVNGQSVPDNAWKGWQARAALAAVEGQAGWRSMDSAPKDGTIFIAYVGERIGLNKPIVSSCRWIVSEKFKAGGAWDTWQDGFPIPLGWLPRDFLPVSPKQETE
jgi:hypothetical protein